MGVSNQIEYKPVGELFLDPKNPRLGRAAAREGWSQPQILDAMRDWTLDELAHSFIQSGFWPQEALIVVEEEVGLVVVEGNRRLAALKYLQQALDGAPATPRWKSMVEEGADLGELKAIMDNVPILKANDRPSVDAFLGFRHVTGIKEWRPAEKAEFIAKLVDGGLTYTEVMRQIGSKTPTVRRNYIAFRILLQMEEQEDIHVEAVEDRFSLLFLSLREQGVQEYLGVNIESEPADAQTPIAPDRLENLSHFSRWLFGDEETDELVTDSRHIATFARILLSEPGLDYLENSKAPNLSRAVALSGADVPDVIESFRDIVDGLETQLGIVHLYDDPALNRMIERFLKGAAALAARYPKQAAVAGIHLDRGEA